MKGTMCDRRMFEVIAGSHIIPVWGDPAGAKLSNE